MPGPAPAKVQHSMLKLSKLLKRDITPVWDADQQVWRVDIEERVECSDALHETLEDSGHCALDGDGVCGKAQDGHRVTVEVAFHHDGWRYGVQVWRSRPVWMEMDQGLGFSIPFSMLMSILAKPTDPQGDGKIGGGDSAAAKPLDVRSRTTVIRV